MNKSKIIFECKCEYKNPNTYKIIFSDLETINGKTSSLKFNSLLACETQTESQKKIRLSSLDFSDFNSIKIEIKKIIKFSYFCFSKKKIKEDISIIDFRNQNTNNIAHLFYDIIPLCILVKEKTASCDFIFNNLNQKCIDLLNYFEINPSFSYSKYKAKHIKFFVTSELKSNQLNSIADAISINKHINFKYPNYINTSKKNKDIKNIFIARKGTRTLKNITEISSFLEKKNYKTVFFEDLSIEEQIEFASSAENVVAIHGAAMSFLLTSNKLKSIIEILPPYNHIEMYPQSLSHKVEKYTQIICSKKFDSKDVSIDYSDLVKIKNSSFDLNIEALKVALEI